MKKVEKAKGALRHSHQKMAEVSERTTKRLNELGIENPTLPRPLVNVVLTERGYEYDLICDECHNLVRSRDKKVGHCKCSNWSKKDKWEREI